MIYPIQLVGLLTLAYFTHSLAKNAFSHYWEEHIGILEPPNWFAAKASPLSLYQAEVFKKLIEKKELSVHLETFCKQANIACATNAIKKKTTNDANLPPIVPWNDAKLKYDGQVPKETPLQVASQGGLLFFRESMVKEGHSMLIPDLRDPLSYKAFLPRSLALKIPFSFARINELKKIFGLVDESYMDEYIQDTIKTCEKNPILGEQCICATSVEDLIDFVVQRLGHHVNLWSTESIEGSYENVTVGTVKLIHGNLTEPPALCHSQPFPFQVYYCHIIQKLKVYGIVIHAQKKVNHAIMVCHFDTSTWNPNHLAFKLLGFGPGLIEVCHWINENELVWTKTLG